VALLEPDGGAWHVRQRGPLALADRVEETLDAYDAAGRPDQTAFRMRVEVSGQYLEHPDMPQIAVRTEPA